MIVLITSRTWNRFLSSAAIAAHKAPASMPMINATMIVSGPRVLPNFRLTAVDVQAPINNCPSAPMFRTPPLNATATANPARMRGVARTSMSPRRASAAISLIGQASVASEKSIANCPRVERSFYQRPFTEHHHAVGKVDELVNVTRIEHDGTPRVACPPQMLADHRRRVDVEPSRRVFGYDRIGIAVELSGEHQLLLISSGEILSPHVYAARAHIKTLDERQGLAFYRRPADSALSFTDVLQGHVLVKGERGRETLVLAVLGDKI